MIRLSNPTGRNTRAHIVEIGELEFFFSYETCIAYRSPGVRMRIANSWGPTTGRHFKDLGCANFPTVDRETFERTIGTTIRAIDIAIHELREIAEREAQHANG